MDKEEKLEQLMQESRLAFIDEEREKLNKIIITLLEYRLHMREEERFELERYFHSLNGTSSTLKLEKLSSIGKEWENYINKASKGNSLSERFFLKLLDGLAQVHVNLELLLQIPKVEEESLNSNTVTDENDSSSDNILKVESVSKKSILLVDDVTVILHMMEKNLSSLNYEILTANDGEEAIRKCKWLKPDLMLVDLMLPKIDGFEVCRRIKSDPETKDIKIIVVSSKNRKKDILKCFESGIDDYMIKPFSMRELERRIKSLLG